MIECRFVAWRFWDFGTGPKDGLIDRWLGTVSERAEEAFNSLLKINMKEPIPLRWNGLRRIRGGDAQKEGIWELRFQTDNIQHRVLFFFGPNRWEATLLIGCNHKQAVYDPPDCISSAVTRKKLLMDGKAHYNERKVRLDR